jgi:hypothetical protein
MHRPCDVCGEVYEAKRSSSKYCSGRCRVRAARGSVTEHRDEVAPTLVQLPTESDQIGPVETVTLQHLRDAERDQTVLGQASLALARRLDYGRDTGAGMASLAKQLEASLKAATADVKSAASPLDQARDQLAERRAKRGA